MNVIPRLIIPMSCIESPECCFITDQTLSIQRHASEESLEFTRTRERKKSEVYSSEQKRTWTEWRDV